MDRVFVWDRERKIKKYLNIYMSEVKHLKHEHSKRKDIIGFIILFLLFILIIPYFLFKYTSFAIFITYFANVDIIANILAINFPGHFHHLYDPLIQETSWQYISFNLLSLVALTGIFLAGIHTKGLTKTERLITMIIMAIITWTLPTQGIPYLNNKVQKYLMLDGILKKDEDKRTQVTVTIIISVGFIFLEYLLIRLIVK
jgi:hypothetical protein